MGRKDHPGFVSHPSERQKFIDFKAVPAFAVKDLVQFIGNKKTRVADHDPQPPGIAVDETVSVEFENDGAVRPDIDGDDKTPERALDFTCPGRSIVDPDFKFRPGRLGKGMPGVHEQKSPAVRKIRINPAFRPAGHPAKRTHPIMLFAVPAGAACQGVFPHGRTHVLRMWRASPFALRAASPRPSDIVGWI